MDECKSQVRYKGTIIVNKIQCKNCNDVIESISCHDFRYCRCQSCFVDGGKEYLRRGGDPSSYYELSEYSLS